MIAVIAFFVMAVFVDALVDMVVGVTVFMVLEFTKHEVGMGWPLYLGHTDTTTHTQTDIATFRLNRPRERLLEKGQFVLMFIV